MRVEVTHAAVLLMRFVAWTAGPSKCTDGAAPISQSCPAANCTEIEPPACTRPTV